MQVLCSWEELPEELKSDDIKEYYRILSGKRNALFIKRMFDLVFSLFLLVLSMPV